MSILSDWNIFLLNKLYFPTTNDYTGIDNFRYFERSPSGLIVFTWNDNIEKCSTLF